MSINMPNPPAGYRWDLHKEGNEWVLAIVDRHNERTVSSPVTASKGGVADYVARIAADLLYEHADHVRRVAYRREVDDEFVQLAARLATMGDPK